MSNSLSAFPKIICYEWPGSCRIIFGRIKAECNDQKIRLEAMNGLQRTNQSFMVLICRNLFRERKVEIIPFTGTRTLFIRKTGKVVIDFRWCSVNGDCQHITSFVKDILGPIAMMIIKVKNRDLSVLTEEMGGDGGRVEIAESAEKTPFGVMSRRSH